MRMRQLAHVTFLTVFLVVPLARAQVDGGAVDAGGDGGNAAVDAGALDGGPLDAGGGTTDGGTGPASNDAGIADAGTVDAGSGHDAGHMLDAGALDAAVPPEDSGPLPPSDGGAPRPDDAGTAPPPDAATPPVDDAGPPPPCDPGCIDDATVGVCNAAGELLAVPCEVDETCVIDHCVPPGASPDGGPAAGCQPGCIDDGHEGACSARGELVPFACEPDELCRDGTCKPTGLGADTEGFTCASTGGGATWILFGVPVALWISRRRRRTGADKQPRSPLH